MRDPVDGVPVTSMVEVTLVDRQVELLARVVRSQAAEASPWEDAELHLLECAYRERLQALNVAPTPELAAGLMAVATLLGEHTPEWGGDVRCTLGEIALLGLKLLEDETAG